MFNKINRILIKDYENVTNKIVRKNYGYITSIIGIIVNIILFSLKIFIGIFSNSLSIIADAFNSLSDCISSLISIIAIKISNKPADKEHPFGHGRAEYLASLVVAFFIALLAWEFLKTSIQKILHPENLSTNMLIYIIMIINISLKFCIAKYNKYNGEKISSKVLIATSKDAFNDCIITLITLIVLIIYAFFNINIDGYAGIFLTIVLFKAAFEIAQDTISVLLGEVPDIEFTSKLKKTILNYEGILGVHDLIIHNYGEAYTLATIHAEVSCKEDILKSHELIDKIEKEISDKFDIHLTIHMDPIDFDDPILKDIRVHIYSFLNSNYPTVNAHDFRIVHGKEQTNLIFECKIPFDYNEDNQNNLKNELVKIVNKINTTFICIINFEYGFDS